MKFISINPNSGKVLKKYSTIGSKEIEPALQHSEFAYDINRTSNINLRTKRLLELMTLLDSRKEELALLITTEMGKPIREALAEIEKCKTVCTYYAENAATLLADKEIETDLTFSKSTVQYAPLGIILGIMPWNFPFWQVFRFAIPALTSGNSVILKHSPNVPQCALAIEKLFKDAHFPEGLFQNLFLSNEQVSQFIKDERIQGIAFTGSLKAGKNLAQQAGKNIKKIVLELGGNDAFIVMPQANLKEAARLAVQSRMLNAGQSCIAAKRWIVDKNVVEPFLQIATEYINNLKIDDPRKMETDMGPLAREDLRSNLIGQIEKSVKMGAQLHFGGEVLGKKGYYFSPGILSHVKPGMPAFEEELFGPIATVITADSVHHAIELANETKYGLGASLWTTDLAQATRLAKQLNVGGVFINSMVQSNVNLPFGGVKQSGYGRELGAEGIFEFVNVKTVVIG